jgi:hypothetical protein
MKLHIYREIVYSVIFACLGSIVIEQIKTSTLSIMQNIVFGLLFLILGEYFLYLIDRAKTKN